MNKVISFPHLGDYYLPVLYFLKRITKCQILVPPKITKKTIELGAKYSPDFVCLPFKYNLGNYIESLDKGANIILQAGGGCRYGYYAELQEKILKDLGYQFEFVNFIKNNHVSIWNVYKFAKKINKKLNIISYLYNLIVSLLLMIIMDKLDIYYRKYAGLEINKGQFKKVKQEFKDNIPEKLGIIKLIKYYYKYKNKYHNIEVNNNSNNLKVLLVGELYSLMEHSASSNIEEKLISKGISIERNTNLTYLLITKHFKLKKHLKAGKKYLKYHLGADGTESVVLSMQRAMDKYDGIIHIKSFGCTPEINAMPILNKISNDYSIPIIYFSFDTNDNETAVNTRLEAFYDMLINKRDIIK